MNEQPNPIIGNLVAIAFVCGVVYHTLKAFKNNKPIVMNDLFTLGYVEENHTPIIVKTPPVIVNNVVTKQSSFEDQKLFMDCVDTLVAIGYKRREAKSRAKKIFSSDNPPSTVQAFLEIALRNNS